MRVFPSLLVLLLSALVAGAQTVSQLNAEAQRAFAAGDYTMARAKFTEVLAKDPSNQTATSYLRMIKAQEAKGGGNSLANQLEKLTMSKVDLKEASFSTALEYLKQRAADQSVTVSFVNQIPRETADAKTVTLTISNAPFTEVLRYLCQQADAEYVVEKYAVVVRPRSGAAN